MVKLAVAGAAGRMGRAIIQAIAESPGVELGYAFEHPDSGMIGSDAGEVAGAGPLGVPIEDRLAGDSFDALIEFTGPAATVEHARLCRDAGKRAVIGTTGLSEKEQQAIRGVSEHVAVVMAPNMSVGVNLCFYLVDVAARTLGDGVDIEVLEAHHRHKADAPSGTALRLGEVAAAAVGRDLRDCAVYARQGQTGARDRKTIGFSTIRGGDIVGEHTVLFAGDGERVEITHRSSNRMNFAYGALRAAVWCMEQPKGMFDMQDVLGLK